MTDHSGLIRRARAEAERIRNIPGNVMGVRLGYFCDEDANRLDDLCDALEAERRRAEEAERLALAMASVADTAARTIGFPRPPDGARELLAEIERRHGPAPGDDGPRWSDG
jgi:hypothetical protein